ncbi:coatomer subunit zeta [Maudiozyma humilis]|uniref:Coatomer subunit zeta n=1 Tax=Maudiozyma humilis TaxID=51915 RepID=A0AAV5RT68_MAUHU|nr:coatomer subunit zeta [Kazachstania humilis]
MSLYAIEGVLILDGAGERVYAKYYPHSTAEGAGESPLGSHKQQREFETQLFAKTHKKDAEILLCDGHLVLYKEFVDVSLLLVGAQQENELVLQAAFDAFRGSLELVLSGGLDKKAIEENYDLVLLAVDELCDNGIILETDPAAIASRVTKAPEETVALDLDKGLLGAWGFAKSKFQERLQQGL